MKLAFLPKCDADGSYHVIQCSIHVSRCWCVDRQTGHKVADALTTEGVDTMHCTPPEGELELNILGVSGRCTAGEGTQQGCIRRGGGGERGVAACPEVQSLTLSYTIQVQNCTPRIYLQ